MNTTTATRKPTPLTDRLIAAAIQRAYDANDIATAQHLQRLLGTARGGTAESGGAVR